MKRFHTTKMYTQDSQLSEMGIEGADMRLMGFSVDLDKVIAAEENQILETECTCIYIEGREQPVSIVDDFEEFLKAWQG